MQSRRPFAFGLAGLNVLRGVTASALVLGTVAFTAASASAQSDEDEGTYESPTFGYTLEWNPDDWTVGVEAEADENNGRDLLGLNGTGDFLTLFVEGSEDSWSDTDECATTILDEAAVVAGDEVELSDLPSDGEPIDGGDFEISEDEHSRIATTVEADVEGDSVEIAFFAECYADPDGDLIVGFSGASIAGAAFSDDAYPAVEEIIETLPFAEAGGSDQGEDEPTPRAGGDDEEEASPSSRDDEEEDETPVAGGGVDGNVYTAPTYGFELEFDDSVWTVEGESSEDDVDTLLLSSDDMFATVSGFESADGVEGCVDTYIDILDARGDGDAAVITNSETGEELVFEAEDGSKVEAYFFYSIDGTQLADYMICVDLGDGALLGIDFTGSGDVLASEDGMAQINDLLGGIAF